MSERSVFSTPHHHNIHKIFFFFACSPVSAYVCILCTHWCVCVCVCVHRRRMARRRVCWRARLHWSWSLLTIPTSRTRSTTRPVRCRFQRTSTKAVSTPGVSLTLETSCSGCWLDDSEVWYRIDNEIIPIPSFLLRRVADRTLSQFTLNICSEERAQTGVQFMSDVLPPAETCFSFYSSLVSVQTCPDSRPLFFFRSHLPALSSRSFLTGLCSPVWRTASSCVSRQILSELEPVVQG